MDDIGWFIGITFLLAMGFVGGCLGVAVLTLGAVCLKKIQGWRAGVVVLVLLVPGVGWASSEPEITQGQCDVKGKVSITIEGEGWCVDGLKLINVLQCNQRMEAALKALHPFSMLNLDPVHKQFGLDMVRKKGEWLYRAELPYEDPAGNTPFGHTQTMNHKAGEAIVLWDTVKRECWKEAQP